MTACCSRKRPAARCCATPPLLWGYAVKLLEIEAATDKVLKTYEAETAKADLAIRRRRPASAGLRRNARWFAPVGRPAICANAPP